MTTKNGHIVKLKQDEFILNTFLVCILILNALFLRWNAFRGLNFFDMGAFMDASWRILIGQKPYIDFMFISGPVHLYVNAFFFALFGVGKMAILVHLILASSIAIAITFLIAKKYLPTVLALLTTLLTTVCFYWPISHPWYDQTAHLFGLFALLALVNQTPFQEPRIAFRTGLFSGVMCILSFMTKSNIGFLYGILFALVFIAGNKKINALSGFALGSIATLLIMLVIIRSPALFFEQTVQTFSNDPNQRAFRIRQFLKLSNWLADWYWLPALFIAAQIRFWKYYKELLILTVGIALLSLISVFTGSLKPSANIPLFGIYLTFVLAFSYSIKSLTKTAVEKKINQASIWISSALTLFLIVISAERGLALEAWTYEGQNPYGNYSMQTESIKGWRAEEKTGKAVDELIQFINQNIPKSDSLLVLTDLQILYPLTGHESYKGVPFIFTVPYEPPAGPRMERVRNQIFTHPPDWIVTHRGPTKLGFVDNIIPHLGLKDFIINSYAIVGTFNNYIVLKKKL